MASVKAERLDWRGLCLRACILESCRSGAISWPTGQDWAIPKIESVRTERVPKVPGGIRAVVVNINYMQQGNAMPE